MTEEEDGRRSELGQAAAEEKNGPGQAKERRGMGQVVGPAQKEGWAEPKKEKGPKEKRGPNPKREEIQLEFEFQDSRVLETQTQA